MSLRLRSTVANAAILAASALVLAGCSSSTEPGPSDALVSRISVSRGTIRIGQDIDVVWTVENAGATELSRTFNPQGATGFFLGVTETPDNTILQTIRFRDYIGQGHVLTLAPHAKMILTATLRGAAVGTASVNGCMPPEGTSEKWDCVSKSVMVLQ